MGIQEQKKLKAVREKLGLTQEEVAKKAEIDTNYYARIERGDATPSLKRLKLIYKVLKLEWPF